LLLKKVGNQIKRIISASVLFRKEIRIIRIITSTNCYYNILIFGIIILIILISFLNIYNAFSLGGKLQFLTRKASRKSETASESLSEI